MCFDCGSRNPTWISLTHAIYVCLTCSGKHRRLGTHLSFVRSTEMDKIYPEQLFRMELGGNRRAHDFLREHGADLSQPLDYHGKLAAKHRQMLDRLVASEMHTIGWVTGTQQEASPTMQQKISAPATALTQPHPQPVQGAQPHQTQQQEFSAAPPAGHYGQPLSSSAVPAASAVPPPAPAVVPAASVAPPRSGMGDASWTASGMQGGAAKGVRSRKLEMDFDFEKEAALLAAKQRAAAQGAPQSSATASQPASQQQSVARGGNVNNGFSSAPKIAVNPAFGTSGTSTISTSGGGAAENYGSSNATAGGYGSHSQRFSGAKSISSAQFFNEEER